jgi:hypothetical protein
MENEDLENQVKSLSAINKNLVSALSKSIGEIERLKGLIETVFRERYAATYNKAAIEAKLKQFKEQNQL